MFGRHKQDDYESYNERANEKYDDDYIRPSEEERRECSHDHEQTYDNYDIPHHEIPKSGSTAPQPKNLSSIEDKFLHLLRPGERIMWLGKPVKNASRQERGMAASKTGAIITVAFVIIFAVLSTAVGESGFLCSAMFFMLIIFVTYTISGSINTFYAVTDQRVIAIRGHFHLRRSRKRTRFSVRWIFRDKKSTYSPPDNHGSCLQMRKFF